MFDINNLTKTAWASYHGIPNEIPNKYLKNANRLVDLMNRIEKKWDRKLDYTCAFRGEILNAKMEGHPNSSHQKACAVDFVVLLEDQDKFMSMLKDTFIDEIDFAQNYIFRVKSQKRIPRNFVHINIAEENKTPRKVFNTEICKGKNIVFGTQGSSLDLFKRY